MVLIAGHSSQFSHCSSSLVTVLLSLQFIHHSSFIAVFLSSQFSHCNSLIITVLSSWFTHHGSSLLLNAVHSSPHHGLACTKCPFCTLCSSISIYSKCTTKYIQPYINCVISILVSTLSQYQTVDTRTSCSFLTLPRIFDCREFRDNSKFATVQSKSHKKKRNFYFFD